MRRSSFIERARSRRKREETRSLVYHDWKGWPRERDNVLIIPEKKERRKKKKEGLFIRLHRARDPTVENCWNPTPAFRTEIIKGAEKTREKKKKKEKKEWKKEKGQRIANFLHAKLSSNLLKTRGREDERR